MKKCQLSKLALLGMTGGLMMVGQPGAEAAQDNNSIDIQYLLAKPKCASHGCADLTAERDIPEAAQDDELDVASDDDADYDDEDATDDKTDDGQPKPAGKADLKDAKPATDAKSAVNPAKLAVTV